MLSVCVIVATLSAAEPSDIDASLQRAQQSAGVTAAPLCSNAQFLRRVSLDLVGAIPSHSESESFTRLPDREATVERLLKDPRFPRFWSHVWVDALLGSGGGAAVDREVLRIWLEQQFRDDVPFDRIARELIAAEGQSAVDGPVNFFVRHGEDAAVEVSRLFLGVRLDCARCHDHPHARWTQDDFTAMSRFFQRTQVEEITEGNLRIRNVVLGGSTQELPRFLSGAVPRTRLWRSEFAMFVTNSKPFARNYANRLWYHFFGHGIVDPPDDVEGGDPAAVPELLEALASQASREHFQIKPMIRRICLSQAYRRSSAAQQRSSQQERLFAIRTVKPLHPVQIVDSVSVACERERTEQERRRLLELLKSDMDQGDLMRTWTYRETVQTLLHHLASDVELPAAWTMDDLFWRILSRAPTQRERALCQDQSKQDVAYALLHGNEFLFYH